MVDDSLVVLNTDKLRKNKYFIDYVKSLGLLELGAFESRRTTLDGKDWRHGIESLSPHK